MKVRIPRSPKPWTAEAQESAFAEVEKGFGRLNEYAQAPAGGVAGQTLVKSTARDFDMHWGGSGNLPLDLRSGWVNYSIGYQDAVISKSADGLVTINAIIRNGNPAAGTVLAILPVEMRPTARYGDFLCATSPGTAVCCVYIETDGTLRLASAGANPTWLAIHFSYRI